MRFLPPKNFIHKIVKYFLIFVLLIAAFEIISTLTLQKKISSRLVLQEIYKTEANAQNEMIWNLNLKAHPYFGFVCDRSVYNRNCNNYGFNNHEDYPIKRGPNDFVIGIFGASVAQTLIKYIEMNEELKKKLYQIPELRHKNVRFVNLSMPAYKQPQIYFVAAYFYESLDVAIYLDGLNDVGENPYPLQPLDFPKLYLRFFDDPANDYWSKKVILGMRTFFAKATIAGIDHPILGKSYLYQVVWQKMKSTFNANINKLSYDMTIDRTHEPKSNQFGNLNYQERIDHMTQTWIKYTTLSANLFKENKVAFLHYLQPSQYKKGSKTYSAEESTYVLTSDPFLLKWRIMGNTSIEKAQLELKKKKIPTQSFAELFKNTKETIYIDDYGHVNNLGNTMMAEKIFSDIAGLVKRK